LIYDSQKQYGLKSNALGGGLLDDSEEGPVNHRLCAATAVAVISCLAVPAASSAATRDVYMGTPPSAGKQLEKLISDVNAYFPSNTKIHVGDTVRFMPVGFHNANFPKSGGKPNGLFVAGKPAAGEVDAAGAAFWFNGQPTLTFNPVLGKSLFGKRTTFNGSKAVESGLPLADKPKPFKVRFTKRGRFTYYCSVHTGMKAKVSVVANRTSTPSAKAQAAAIAKQVAKVLATAKALEKKAAPTGGIVDVGVAGSGGVERYAFSPDKITAKVGDTLTFRMSAGSYDVHTATTGPGDAEKEPNSYMGKLAKTFEGDQFPGQATYPSDPPAAGFASLTPTLHGNGFWSTGVLDTAASTPPPRSNAVKIGAPGSYTFICLIHPFMKATVTATA
jgi:plastocyanin